MSSSDVQVPERGASDELSSRCALISCDSHVGPSVRRQLREYCPSEHLEAFDRYTEEMEQAPLLTIELNTEDYSPEVQTSTGDRAFVEGLQDPAARLRDMDAEGVAANVLYHGGLNGQAVPFSRTGLASWRSEEYDPLEPVGVHVYNRWLADYVAVAPERFVGVAHISMHSVETAVAEASWARDHGLTAINLPAPRRDLVPYTDPDWERFWAVCADLELTLSTHGGGGDIDGRFTGMAQSPIWLVEMPWMGRRAVWQLIFAGVFERHPSLYFVVSEQFGEWIPGTLKEMDSAYLSLRSTSRSLRSGLPKLPSDYFRSNCVVCASFMSHDEALLGVEHDLVQNLLWGNDYPHPEGTFPHSDLSLRKTLAGIDRPVVDAYLSGNAARVYRMDLATVRSHAAAIGPTYAALAEPYVADVPPADIPASMGFRRYGNWY